MSDNGYLEMPKYATLYHSTVSYKHVYNFTDRTLHSIITHAEPSTTGMSNSRIVHLVVAYIYGSLFGF